MQVRREVGKSYGTWKRQSGGKVKVKRAGAIKDNPLPWPSILPYPEWVSGILQVLLSALLQCAFFDCPTRSVTYFCHNPANTHQEIILSAANRHHSSKSERHSKRLNASLMVTDTLLV